MQPTILAQYWLEHLRNEEQKLQRGFRTRSETGLKQARTGGMTEDRKEDHHKQA
jgi:hypothetical protein